MILCQFQTLISKDIKKPNPNIFIYKKYIESIQYFKGVAIVKFLKYEEEEEDDEWWDDIEE